MNPISVMALTFRSIVLPSPFNLLSAALFIGALFLTPSSTPAALTYYDLRASFDSVHPNLPTETFEAGNIAPGTFALFTGPLNSSTSNTLFSPGSILPGLTVVDSPGPDANDMVYAGDGTHPGVSKAILSRPFNDSTDLIFAPGVPAVGFDFAAAIGAGRINFGSFTISVYGASGFLGSRFISTPEALSFFGVDSSADLITRVSVFDGAIHSELIDNVSFGIPVPEPGSLSLLACALGAAMATLRRTKRSTATQGRSVLCLAPKWPNEADRGATGAGETPALLSGAGSRVQRATVSK